MFRVSLLSVVLLAVTLSPLAANAEELRPSKLRPYELGPDGSLVVSGSTRLSGHTPARDPLELSLRLTRGSAGADRIRSGLIDSGVKETKIDEMVKSAESLAEKDSGHLLQGLISQKISESEENKDWQRMALFQYLNQVLYPEESTQ